ncbi:tRNA pseudouridine(38-40) synthase TruA [Luteimonas deserti]|uniref:tRNA pseudouridine synthase A n=1 Tax=Luteimonas deserti TaxID=2752306 RepID=A0A7Z0QU44_9GAMM|nr:tRNA pseudouridine(38-40) synthase TruA [Luteimonas deserti]NYZ63840.1 tRNA pseudouridine(38-40) synthase TruA [Luteimonas deserti]
MRLALGVEYDGNPFLGWQRLSKAGEGGQESVQAALETALGRIATHPVATTCSGRTDAGVHARCQVVHFDTDAVRTPRAWMLGTTTHLPPSVCVHWCQPVPDEFNARFSARARHYRYSILNRAVRPALHRQYLSWELRPLDAGAMHRAAQALVGEQDFSAFRSAQCQAPHARRDLQRISVERIGDEVVVEVQANAFLHHMVRNIVGSLLEIGAGAQDEAWIATLLAERDRTRAGPTAPAAGLVFLGPLYPPEWGLPAGVTLPP